jgi:hypothetical protein
VDSSSIIYFCPRAKEQPRASLSAPAGASLATRPISSPSKQNRSIRTEERINMVRVLSEEDTLTSSSSSLSKDHNAADHRVDDEGHHFRKWVRYIRQAEQCQSFVAFIGLLDPSSVADSYSSEELEATKSFRLVMTRQDYRQHDVHGELIPLSTMLLADIPIKKDLSFIKTKIQIDTRIPSHSITCYDLMRPGNILDDNLLCQQLDHTCEILICPAHT